MAKPTRKMDSTAKLKLYWPKSAKNQRYVGPVITKSRGPLIISLDECMACPLTATADFEYEELPFNIREWPEGVQRAWLRWRAYFAVGALEESTDSWSTLVRARLRQIYNEAYINTRCCSAKDLGKQIELDRKLFGPGQLFVGASQKKSPTKAVANSALRAQRQSFVTFKDTSYPWRPDPWPLPSLEAASVAQFLAWTFTRNDKGVNFLGWYKFYNESLKGSNLIESQMYNHWLGWPLALDTSLHFSPYAYFKDPVCIPFTGRPLGWPLTYPELLGNPDERRAFCGDHNGDGQSFIDWYIQQEDVPFCREHVQPKYSNCRDCAFLIYKEWWSS